MILNLPSHGIGRRLGEVFSDHRDFLAPQGPTGSGSKFEKTWERIPIVGAVCFFVCGGVAGVVERC